MRDIGIIVGYGHDYSFDKPQNSQENIVRALKKKGYNAIKVDEQWPRDSYVQFNDNYVFRGEAGINGNIFGEGGNVQRGKDYILVSDNAYCFNDIKRESDIKNHEEFEKTVKRLGKKEHNSKIYVAPTGIDFSKEKVEFSKMGHGHIDMFTLLLPESKILFYDTHFGKGANQNKIYNEIAKNEGLEFIEFNGSKNGVWYPLNAAVLSGKDSECVLLDSKARSLIEELVKRGIDVIPVEMPQNSNPAGKLNCQTNTFYLKDEKKILSLFD